MSLAPDSRTQNAMVYLVRHAATSANLAKPYTLQGQGVDLPLSTLGRRQAEAAGRALQIQPIQSVFSSPMRRGVETAQTIALPHQLSVRTIPELIECNVGSWEGLCWQEIQLTHPESYAAFQADPATTPYKDGESYQQVQTRAVPTIQRLIEQHPKGQFVIVTHNIVARVYVAHLLGLSLAQARHLRLDNCGITVLKTVQESERPAAQLVTLNSVLHLDDVMTES